MVRTRPVRIVLVAVVLGACASAGGPPRSRDGRPAPSYSVILASAGVEGEVQLDVTVDSLGQAIPASLRVRRSSHELFLLAARKAVLRWRFAPAPGTTEVLITFELASKDKRCHSRVPAGDSLPQPTWYRYDRTTAHAYVYICPTPQVHRHIVYQ